MATEESQGWGEVDRLKKTQALIAASGKTYLKRVATGGNQVSCFWRVRLQGKAQGKLCSIELQLEMSV